MGKRRSLPGTLRGSPSAEARMPAVPKLAISTVLAQPERYDPDTRYSFRYRAKGHRELPHVVKFSGGRSSGLLVFTLVENGFLKRERGDVVIFNNTSCEHPETYKFVSECKDRVEERGIPFFLTEFQTYEDARRGEWRRLPSYRLVNDRPFSDGNPDGYRWRGEIFEEMLSYKGYLPNQFSRVCTQSLKLDVTREFLRDWFANKRSIPRQGHGLTESQVDTDQMYSRHIRDGGGIPKNILLEKKKFVLNCRPNRPKQEYVGFSAPAAPFENNDLEGKVFGKKAWFGNGGMEYVAFIGLRGDERLRVARVETRSSNPHANIGYEGEHVYMPLAFMNIHRKDVDDFWGRQDWNLNLPKDGILSNCVYCFLKGIGGLKHVHREMEQQKTSEVTGFGSTVDTPCDVNWWVAKERRYGRDLEKERRQRTNPNAGSFIGFFGGTSGFSFGVLADSGENERGLGEFSATVMPCDCTE